MKIGIAYTPFLKHYSRFGEDRYLKMKEHGFDTVDYNTVDTESEWYLLSEDELKLKVAKEKELADSAGIEFHQAHGPWRCPPRDNTPELRAERLEKMKKSIDIAVMLGCKYWVIHPIMPCNLSDLPRGKAQETWDLNVEFFTELLNYVKQYDITICLENMPFTDFSLAKPEDIIRLVKEIDNEQFKVCLDTGHVAMFPELSAGDSVRKAGDLLKCLHIHDNNGDTDAHMFPTMGRTDWTDFINALYEIGYEGVFSLETAAPQRLDDEEFEKESVRLYNISKELTDKKF